MNKLKYLRKNKNLNQKDIANYLNIATSTYSYWENEKYEIDLKSLKKLSNFYNVSIDFILDNTQNEYSIDEIKLLNKYKKLNTIGKSKISAYLDGLLDNQDNSKS